MKLSGHKSIRNIAIGAMALAVGLAQAHTGHGTSGFAEGLIHPIGLDHLLAMLAVGIWSVSALPANKVWWGPCAFMLTLIASAALGALGLTVPFLEYLISLSVVIFGAMLLLTRRKLPIAIGLGMVVLAAALHGLAHGAEAPQIGFPSYAAGFLLTTGALHFGGVFTGLCIRRFIARRASWVIGGLGAVFGGTGLYLLSQL
jgi:urease accessory protein